MSLLPVTRGKSQFLFGLKPSFCSFFDGFKHAEMNKFVVASDAGDIFVQAFGKVDTSHATAIGGSFSLVFHIDSLRDNSEVRPDIVTGHAINVVNIFRPVSKHQKCRYPVSEIEFAKYSESGIPFCVQCWAYNFPRVARVVFLAPAFWGVSGVRILTRLKHIRRSCKPSKMTSLWVILNGCLNKFVNLCHNKTVPLLFDSGYTSLRNTHQGA